MSTQAGEVEIAEGRSQDLVANDSPARHRSAEQLSPSATALSGLRLGKTYGKRRVVDDVSLHVEKGEVVGLLGANGAGKTTTFYMIVGLERPDSGVVTLGDRDLTKL